MPVKTPHNALREELLTGPLRYIGSHSIFSKMRIQYTPDLHELNKRMFHYVFIPKKLGTPLGAMKRYFENPSTKYMGGGISVGDGYEMYTSELGQRVESYLVSDKLTTTDRNITNRAHVEGFVLAVPVSVICEMDLSYNHGYQTERNIKHFWLTAQKNTPSVPAFVWTYKREYLDRSGVNKPVQKFIRYTGSVKSVQGGNTFL